MFSEYMKSIGLILPITLMTIALEALIIPRMPNSGNSSTLGVMFGFLIFGLGFGWLAILVYHWVGNRWPDNATLVYLWLAIVSAILFTLLAVGMHFAVKSPWVVVVVWTVMNFLWGLGYGWFLPQVLSSLPTPV